MTTAGAVLSIGHAILSDYVFPIRSHDQQACLFRAMPDVYGSVCAPVQAAQAEHIKAQGMKQSDAQFRASYKQAERHFEKSMKQEKDLADRDVRMEGKHEEAEIVSRLRSSPHDRCSCSKAAGTHTCARCPSAPRIARMPA